MASETTLYKSFTAFGGLDLRVSDLLREKNMATEATNAIFRDSGALSKRKGFQAVTRSNAGIELTRFSVYNRVDESRSDELLSTDTRLKKVIEDSFVVSYAGVGTAYYNLYLNPNDHNFYYSIEVDGVNVFELNLGTGKESSFVTIADLITAINLVADFTATSPTLDTEPAAFIPFNRNIVIQATGTTISFYRWDNITIPVSGTNPLLWSNTRKNLDSYEPPTFATMNDVLYVCSKDDGLFKYDGNRFYRAGMPRIYSAPTLNSTPAGSLTGVYKWKITMEHTDAQQNILESTASPVFSYTAAGTAIKLNISTFSPNYYNTDEGTSTVGGIGSTIPLDVGHKLLKGDNVYIKDYITGRVGSHQLIDVTATDFTVGTMASVAPGDVISNMKISIWRTKAGGDTFYLSGEIVHDLAGSITYTDDVADSALGAEFIEPLVNYTEIPYMKYITTWRGNMYGADRFSGTIYFSEVNSPEQWHSADYNFLIDTATGGDITGISFIDNALFVFKENSINLINGDVITGNFSNDQLSTQGIGCVSNRTIIQNKGNIFFLSSIGPYLLAQNGELKFIGEKLSPKFTRSLFNFKRAFAVNWTSENQILLHMPVIEQSTGLTAYCGTQSKTFVFDTFRGAWLEWDNYDIHGGFAQYNDKFFKISWELDPTTGSTQYYLCKISDNNDEYDYADHTSPIYFSYATNWENLGEPTIWKKFTRIKLHSLEGSAESFESNQFQINIDTEHDYQPIVLSSFSLDFSGGASGWGNSPWGNFPWGEVRLTSLKHGLIRRKSRSIRVRFSNDKILQNLLISGFELEIVTPFKPRIKE